MQGAPITPEEIETFREGANDLIFRAQQLVDTNGEPRHGFQVISMDAIYVAMMLAGAEGMRQGLAANVLDLETV